MRSPCASFKLSSFVGLCGLAFLLLPAPASALTVLKMTERDLVVHSDLIVQGTVLSKQSIWGPNRMGIVTLVTFQVDREIVGRSAPSQIVVRHFGGQIGEMKVEMPGGPYFAIGGEFLLILERSPHLPAYEYLMVGWTQGRWHVLRPSIKDKPSFSGETLVTRVPFAKAYPTPSEQVELAPELYTLTALVTRLQGHWKSIEADRKAGRLQKRPAFQPAVLAPIRRPSLPIPSAPQVPSKTPTSPAIPVKPVQSPE